MVAHLDASDVLECYLLQRQAHLHGLANSSIPVHKWALGIRYRRRRQYNSNVNVNTNNNHLVLPPQPPPKALELTLEYGPLRAGPDLQHEVIPRLWQDTAAIATGDAAAAASSSSSSSSPPPLLHITWDNDARVYYTTHISSRIFRQANYVASLTGAVLETVLQAAVAYPLTGSHRRYQPFAVYNASKVWPSAAAAVVTNKKKKKMENEEETNDDNDNDDDNDATNSNNNNNNNNNINDNTPETDNNHGRPHRWWQWRQRHRRQYRRRNSSSKLRARFLSWSSWTEYWFTQQHHPSSRNRKLPMTISSSSSSSSSSISTLRPTDPAHSIPFDAASATTTTAAAEEEEEVVVEDESYGLLLKSSNDVDFVRAMWRHLAEVGVDLQPLIVPTHYQLRLLATDIQRLPTTQDYYSLYDDHHENNNNNENTVSGERTSDGGAGGTGINRMALFTSQLYQCLEAMAAGNYSHARYPQAAAATTTTTLVPTMVPTTSTPTVVPAARLANATTPTTTPLGNGGIRSLRRRRGQDSNLLQQQQQEEEEYDALSSATVDDNHTTTFMISTNDTDLGDTTNQTLGPTASAAPTAAPTASIADTTPATTTAADAVNQVTHEAAQAAQEAQTAAQAAQDSGNPQAAQAAQAAATAAQKAAQSTASQAAAMLQTSLLSGDGTAMVQAVAVCFQSQTYGLAAPLPSSSQATVPSSSDSSSSSSSSSGGGGGGGRTRAVEAASATVPANTSNATPAAANTTTTTITKTNVTNNATTNVPPPSPTWALGYIYWDGAFYYQVNLTAPFLQIVPHTPALPVPPVLVTPGGDVVDWMLAFIVLVFSLIGFFWLVQQVTGHNCGIPYMYKLQQTLFDPMHLHHMENDFNVHKMLLEGGGRGHAYTFAEDVIPLSMGGRMPSPFVRNRARRTAGTEDWSERDSDSEHQHVVNGNNDIGDMELTTTTNAKTRGGRNKTKATRRKKATSGDSAVEAFYDNGEVDLPSLQSSSRVAMPATSYDADDLMNGDDEDELDDDNDRNDGALFRKVSANKKAYYSLSDEEDDHGIELKQKASR